MEIGRSNVRSKEKRGSEIWDQRNIQEEERGSTIFKRVCEKEKQEHSKRESFKSIVFNLDLEIVQSFQEIFNQQSTSSQAFNRSFILRKSEKGVLHLSKAFIVIFAHLRSCYCIHLCSKYSYSLWVFALIFGGFPKQGKVDPNLKSECFGFTCTRKTSDLAWDS